MPRPASAGPRVCRIQQGRAFIALGDAQDLSVGGAEVKQLFAVYRRGPEPSSTVSVICRNSSSRSTSCRSIAERWRLILPDPRQVEGQHDGKQQAGTQYYPGAFLEGFGAAETVSATADDRQLPVGYSKLFFKPWLLSGRSTSPGNRPPRCLQGERRLA